MIATAVIAPNRMTNSRKDSDANMLANLLKYKLRTPLVFKPSSSVLVNNIRLTYMNGN